LFKRENGCRQQTAAWSPSGKEWRNRGKIGGTAAVQCEADLVSARRILWQLVNKPQLAGSNEQVRPRTSDGWENRENRESQKQISPRKFMQNYFVKFALRHRPFF